MLCISAVILKPPVVSYPVSLLKTILPALQNILNNKITLSHVLYIIT
jgi:hypothetical protein